MDTTDEVRIAWFDAEKILARDADGAAAVVEAARVADRPYAVGHTASSLLASMRYGWDLEGATAGLAYDARGRVVGLAELSMSERDNRHVGYLDLTVDPVVRRRGIGRALLDATVDRVRAAGRTVLIAGSPDLPASADFATAVGLTRAATEIHRRQDVTCLDWDRLDAERSQAAERASGYELIRIPHPTPEDLIEAVARATQAINDAPRGALEIEDEVFDADRIRGFDTAQLRRGRRMYRLAARHRDTGELAGHTVIGVDSEHPWHAWQYDTSVHRAHRGRRLGLLLKIEMLRWLAEEEPQLRAVETQNADDNSHMIRVNELLGYEVIGAAVEWQRRIG